MKLIKLAYSEGDPNPIFAVLFAPEDQLAFRVEGLTDDQLRRISEADHDIANMVRRLRNDVELRKVGMMPNTIRGRRPLPPGVLPDVPDIPRVGRSTESYEDGAYRELTADDVPTEEPRRLGVGQVYTREGVPTNPQAGDEYIDPIDERRYEYDGETWQRWSDEV